MDGKVPELVQAVNVLTSEADQLRRKLELVERDLASIHQAMAVVARLRGVSPGELQVPVVAIQHCGTYKEALYEIARMNGGVVNASVAAKLILAAGLKRKGTASPVSSLYQLMSKDDEWEKVSPGTFRLLSLVDALGSGEKKPDGNGEKWQDEYYPIDNGVLYQGEYPENEGTLAGQGSIIGTP